MSAPQLLVSSWDRPTAGLPPREVLTKKQKRNQKRREAKKKCALSGSDPASDLAEQPAVEPNVEPDLEWLAANRPGSCAASEQPTLLRSVMLLNC